MKGILIALLVFALPLAAQAAPAPPGASAAAANGYTAYTANTFGFKVNLPSTGTTTGPGSPGWDRDDEVAFEWYGADADPVRLIMARVDDAGTALDAASFRAFTDELLSYWSAGHDSAGGDKAKAAADKDRNPFEVRNTADNLQIGGRTWNLIEVADHSDRDTTVFYSVFSTYEGSKIYTLTFYYLQPAMDQVQDFGKPVLQGFKVLGG